MSMSAVVQAITNYGPISRASVSKITGLSKQTVSEIVSNLEEEGWVGIVGQTGGHVGRRAVIYELMPDAAAVASVDLGGAKVRVAVCNLVGAVQSELVEPTNREGGMVAVDQIAGLIRKACRAAGIPAEKVMIAVVGVPGVPDPGTGYVRMAPNIAGIDRIDVRSLLRERLQIDVLVENDVNLAAIGEHWLVDRSDGDNLIYLSVGTGIGVGIVAGGQLMRGATGAAGEIGYLPFGADPFEPESRKTGALERVAATRAIIEQYRELSGRTATVPTIFDAARQGDQAATRALESVARQIARAIAALVAVADPSRIVIGGSIGAREELLELIRADLARCFPRRIPVEKSVLGNHAALAGGVSIALSQLHLSVFAQGLKGVEIAVPPPGPGNFRVGAA